MKFNMKNRPKIEDVWKSELSGTEDGYNSEAASIAGEMEEWFEGFQKELQEWYGQCIVDGVIPHSLVYILIKEILGE